MRGMVVGAEGVVTAYDGEGWDYDERVICVRETDKALALRVIDSKSGSPKPGTGFWVPISVVHDDSEVYGLGHEGRLVVEHWWGDKTWG